MKRSEMIYQIMLPYVLMTRDDKKIDNKKFCDRLLEYLEENGMMPPTTNTDVYNPSPSYEWEDE